MPEIQRIDTAKDTSEILQDYTLILVKSCNDILDNIEGRGYK